MKVYGNYNNIFAKLNQRCNGHQNGNNKNSNIMGKLIDGGLYSRQGKAVTNFQLKLPEPQSDLAEQTLKDPYNFDFLTLREEYDEKELEEALINQINQFLMQCCTSTALRN